MKCKKHKKKTINKIVIITILLGLIILCGISVYKNKFNYYSVKNRVNDIKKTKVQDYNPIGWLRIQGTNIDFPIFNNSDIDVSDDIRDLGWTNKDYDDKLEYRSVFLSHNIRNVSNKPLIANKEHERFEQLPSFLYYKFASKNKYFQFTTAGKNYLFKIYSVYIEKDFDTSDKYLDEKETKKYIDKAIKKSYFKYNVDVSEKDNLITLVTCTRFYGSSSKYSIVVEGRKVRKNEKISNYSVYKNKNYKKIETILKGDV